jgi:hypothetical protein
MVRNRLKIVVIAAVLLITSCSQVPRNASGATSTTKESSGPAQPVTGKTAFWEMYTAAHSWARDLQPLGLESRSVPGVTNADGKAGMWTATFGSSSRREARVYTYSVTNGPNIYKGTTVGSALVWNGPSRESMPIVPDSFTIDSDAAYKTASAQAADWLRKHPGKDVAITLGHNSSRFSDPVWFLFWGDKKSGYAVYVNATTGAIMK